MAKATVATHRIRFGVQIITAGTIVFLLVVFSAWSSSDSLKPFLTFIFGWLTCIPIAGYISVWNAHRKRLWDLCLWRSFLVLAGQLILSSQSILIFLSLLESLKNGEQSPFNFLTYLAPLAALACAFSPGLKVRTSASGDSFTARPALSTQTIVFK